MAKPHAPIICIDIYRFSMKPKDTSYKPIYTHKANGVINIGNFDLNIMPISYRIALKDNPLYITTWRYDAYRVWHYKTRHAQYHFCICCRLMYIAQDAEYGYANLPMCISGLFIRNPKTIITGGAPMNLDYIPPMCYVLHITYVPVDYMDNLPYKVYNIMFDGTRMRGLLCNMPIHIHRIYMKDTNIRHIYGYACDSICTFTHNVSALSRVLYYTKDIIRPVGRSRPSPYTNLI
jgi:hypothetical protein